MSIAEKFEIIADAVYEKGLADGKAEGGNTEEAYNQGVTDGRQAEWSDFWDSLQQKGTRTDYYMGFASWKNEIFKPKYDLKPINAQYMFNSTTIKNLVQILTERNVVLNTSNCGNLSYMFLASQITEIPYIDCRSAQYTSSIGGMFQNCAYLVKIHGLYVREDLTYTNTFLNCNELQDVTIEGTIGNSLSIVTPLNKRSIENVIAALSLTASGQTLTLKKTAVQNAFGTNYDSSTEWTTLKNSKSNWTISLI